MSAWAILALVGGGAVVVASAVVLWVGGAFHDARVRYSDAWFRGQR